MTQLPTLLRPYGLLRGMNFSRYFRSREVEACRVVLLQVDFLQAMPLRITRFSPEHWKKLAQSQQP